MSSFCESNVHVRFFFRNCFCVDVNKHRVARVKHKMADRMTDDSMENDGMAKTTEERIDLSDDSKLEINSSF